jgi:hypothetical protein
LEEFEDEKPDRKEAELGNQTQDCKTLYKKLFK